jgi:hypothetical protein
VVLKSKQQTVALTADDEGRACTTNLKAGEKYEVEVTMIGYKTTVVEIENNREPSPQWIMLEKEFKECEPVVVRAGTRIIHCGWAYEAVKVTECSSSLTKSGPIVSISESATLLATIRIYPNPVRRTGTITIAMQNVQDPSISVRIFNASGSLVYAQALTSKAMMNVPVSAQWTPGVYFIQLSDRNGKLIKTDQLIIQ